MKNISNLILIIAGITLTILSSIAPISEGQWVLLFLTGAGAMVVGFYSWENKK